MTGWHLFRGESYQPHAVVVLAVLALWGGRLSAVEASAPSSAARHEVIILTNITPERGKEFLSRLKIATASKIPGTNALLVTGEPSEVQKAVAVLSLVDTRTAFDVKELGPAVAGQVPSSAEIAAAATGVSVGTFAHPPQDKNKTRVIVDVHHGTIVAIAPLFQMQDLQRAVELGSKILKQQKTSDKTTKETPSSEPPVSSEPPEPGVASGLQVSTADAPQTIAAPAMLGSSFTPKTTDGNADVGQAAGEIPQKSSVAAPIPSAERAEVLAEPKAEPKSLTASGAKPESTAPADSQPASSKPAAEQANAKVEPTAPAAPQSSKPAAGLSSAKPAEPSPAAKSNEPAATESAAPPAGQPAAARATPVTPSPAAPAPQATPVAASRATPAAQSAAASPFRPEALANGDQVLDLTLQEKMPVIQLLDLVGKYLGLSYVYNPDEVKGEVSLKLNGDLHGQIRVSQLYPLLEQSLRQLNLITTRYKGNVVSIVPATRIMDADPPLIDRSFPRVESGDTAVTCKFELKYIDTAAAKSLLESMKVSDNVIAVPEKHMLMVTTYAYRMERVERLLQMIDQPGEPKRFRSRQLRYTMAKNLSDKVKAMAEQMLESVTVTVAESETSSAAPPRQPGENDVAYRARVNAQRVVQAQQQAALRAQQQALRGQMAAPEAKQSVYLDADERTNRVLMIGAEKQLTIVAELVEALDVQQQDLRNLQLYRMQHVDAEDVARKLQELGIISKVPDSTTSTRYPTTTSRITPQLPGQPRPPNTPTPEPQVAPTTEVTEKGLVEEPQVVVVEATNSLLVNATVEQHAKIAHIIEFVDSETLTNEIPYKIYLLENSGPKHLAELLQSLIQDTVEQQKEGGKIEKVVVNKDEKIKIVPDPNTCSVIVYANKKNQEWIANLISQLDKRRPQVLIDVTLVTITNHDKFDYDLNFVRSSSDLASTAQVAGLTPPGGTALGKAVATGGGNLTAFYGDKQIQALLSTVQEKTYGRVLAKPKLLVNDNEKGKIDTKDTTYVETTSSLPVTGGGAAGTTTGLVQTSTNFQNYDAGITLNITPHISEGDLLRLDIQIVRSDFGVILGTRPPDKKSSEVDTAVTLPDGTTVILGGMLKTNQTKGGSKVPLLSEIPILGGLFRSVHNSEEGEYLYMFVKAEIIRPDDTSAHGMKGLQVLSDKNRQAFEKRELEFQTYQDWPGIKPKRVDPPKVLDAQ